MRTKPFGGHVPVGRYKYKQSKLLAATVIDRAARSVFWLSRHLRRGRRETATPSKRERILVVQTGAVGDVVMSLPALTALERQYPKAKITLVAGPWATSILAEEDLVDEIVCLHPPWLRGANIREAIRFWSGAIKLRRRRLDLGVDLRGDPRSLLFLYLTGAVERASYGWHGARLGEYLLTQVVPGPAPEAHLVDRFLAVVAHLGCQSESRAPRIHLARHEQTAAEVWRRQILSRGGANVLVGIHPGAANPLRHWRLERFAALARRLSSVPGVSVVVFAGPGDEAPAAEIVRRAGGAVVMEQLPLRAFIVSVSALDALVALDSSPAHIGVALGVPVITLFGPALPEFVGPVGPTARIIQAGAFECRPCTQTTCVHPDASCMDAISTDAVLATTLDALAARRSSQPGQVLRV